MWLICMFQVTFTEEHISFLHFLTNVCAIVGGNYQMIINLITSWFILTVESSTFLDFFMFYELKLRHSIFHMIINFINLLIDYINHLETWTESFAACYILEGFLLFHLISDACSAWVWKLLKCYWSLLIAVALSFFSLSFFWHKQCCFSGVFTVSGILDSFIYHGQKAIKKKMEIGKFSWMVLLV